MGLKQSRLVLEDQGQPLSLVVQASCKVQLGVLALLVVLVGQEVEALQALRTRGVPEELATLQVGAVRLDPTVTVGLASQ